MSKLEQEGVTKEHILVVPVDETYENMKVFNSLHDADGVSFVDKALALATAFGVVGTSIGFKLEWGPIIWGLIAAFIGFLCGLVWNLCIIKFTKNGYRKEKRVLPLIIVIVECEREYVKGIESILRENKAIGYSTTG
ncbi:hypothetical protein [Paenibacillus sambharensis]|uniref:hypothetical protein n=1 Tax=Paenibacillus sambharensis TaxID=1803190 RepID=UPI001FE8D803|nr:hypothetical protein [Paenibacillus sambharensis]